jgi:hypothetical protein
MQKAREEICEAFPLFKVDESVDGLALSSFQIPFRDGLYDILFNKYKIEVFIHQLGDKLFLRISCFSVYNDIFDYRRLIAALKEIGY